MVNEEERVAVWGQHTVQAGRVDVGWMEGEREDDDHEYLDEEMAAAWASVEVDGSNTEYLRTAGRNALRKLEG
jgi:hypothetical protein